MAARHAFSKRQPNYSRRRYLGMLALLTVVISTFGLLASLSAGIHPERFASFSVVPRKPFIHAYSPLALAQMGLPPNSSVTNVPKASPEVRAITVQPTHILMNSLGKTFRIIPLAEPVTTLPQLVKIIDDPSWIADTGRGKITILAALIIDRGASMTVGGSSVHTVRLLKEPSVMIGTREGKLNFRDVTVEAAGTVDSTDSFYRPFVAATLKGVMNVTDSKFIGLGWDWNASYGASWEDGSTGRVTGSTFEDGYIGAYTGQARDVVFRDDTFRDNALYGLDPHTYSHGLVIEHVVAEGNRAHGIIFSNHVTDSVISDSVSRDNGENGIMMDLSSTHNQITGNTVYGNVGDGLVTTNSPDNVFKMNDVHNNRIGVRLSSSDTQSTRLVANHVTDNGLAGQNVRFTRSNFTRDNGGQWDERIVVSIWVTVVAVIGITAILLAAAGSRKRRRQPARLVPAVS